jgi:hypothetical protein
METLSANYSNFTGTGLAYWNGSTKSLSILGDYSSLLSKLDDNKQLAVTMSTTISSQKVMDLTLYYTLQDLEELFDYLNTVQVSDFDRHGILTDEVNQIVSLLTATLAALSTLTQFDKSELDAVLKSSMDSALSASVLLDAYNNLNVKLVELMQLTDKRMQQLHTLDAEILSVESSLSSGYSLIGMNTSTTDLMNNLKFAASRVAQITNSTVNDIARYCAGNADTAAKLSTFKNNIAESANLLSQAQELKTEVDKLPQIYSNISSLVSAAESKCAELSEFLRCLQLYESQMIRAGAAVAIEKEDKVFKVHGIAPPMPECPPIQYVPATTTPSPVADVPVIKDNIPVTTTPSPCAALTITKNSSDHWFFRHTDLEDTMVRTIDLVSSTKPDVNIVNSNSYTVTVELAVTMSLNSDNSARFQILKNSIPLQATDIVGASTTGVQGAVMPQYISLAGDPKTISQQECTASYKFLINASESIDLIFKGSLPGSDMSGVDKWWVKSCKLKAYYGDIACNAETELSTTIEDSIAQILDGREWGCQANWVGDNKYIKDVQKDQMNARASGQPVFDSNKYTTGANSRDIVRLVLCRFAYNPNKNNEVFIKYLYTNYLMDNTFGISFYDDDIAVIKDWIATVGKDYVYVETTDWRVMRQICETGRYGA